ncbi:MAG: hypothetical protein AAGH79_18285 [Bacteroidota bacterium]
MLTTLRRLANWPVLNLLIIGMLYCMFFWFPDYDQQAQAIAEKEVPILDTRWNYDLLAVTTLFTDLGEEGQQIYEEVLSFPDRIYPIVYGLLFFLWLIRLTRNRPVAWSLLALVPLAAVGFDYWENTQILAMLSGGNTLTKAMVAQALVATRLKWIMVGCSVFLIAGLSVLHWWEQR